MNGIIYDSSVKIELPDSVKKIIGRLEAEGFEAWAVGGCVRDSLLGREPKDWDITTSALPEEIKKVFDRTVDTGIEHGTVTVMIDGCGYETTTYRIDGKYSDARHPDSVQFSRSLEEDLKRRDFTINAMAYSDKCGLVDMFGGSSDLKARIIRCVGNPIERFTEDALRILRAVRFSAQLNCSVDNATLEAARTLKDRLKLISVERIHAELEKLLMSKHPDRLEIIAQAGIASVILPELDDLYHNNTDRFRKMIALLQAAPFDKYVRWAALLSMTGCGIELLRSLKFDNNTIDTVSELLRLEKVPVTGLDDPQMRRLMHDAKAENMPLLFSYRQTVEPESDLASPISQYERILKNGDCTDIKELAVNGFDLMEIGVPAGRQVGQTLVYLLDLVLNDPSLNTRPQLLETVKEKITDGSI